MAFYDENPFGDENPFADLTSNNNQTTFSELEIEEEQGVEEEEQEEEAEEQEIEREVETEAESEEREVIVPEQEPQKPKEPLFRPFGVSATLTSSTDQLTSPTTNSRPVLPDILGGGTSILLPESRTALPAFKKSAPKTTTTTTTTNTQKNNNQTTTTQAQPKPYRPLGLKIPQPKPIIAATTSTERNNSEELKPKNTTTSETDKTNHSDPPAISTSDPTSVVVGIVKEEEEKEVASTSQEIKTSLSIQVPPPPSSLPSLVSLPSQSINDEDSEQPIPPESLAQAREHDNDDQQTVTQEQEQQEQQEPAIETQLTVPEGKAYDSDSEDERPLSSVREGLVQQQLQQQQQQQQHTRTPPSRIDSSIAPTTPHTSTSTSTPTPSPTPLYKCSVGDPQKMGMINDIHTVYTVKTIATEPSTNGPLKNSSTVLRRFRDFVWLFDVLVSNNPGIIVPPIPDKNLRHRFQEGFIAARRVALEFFLQKTVNHPMLTSDPDLKLFLESDAFGLEIKHRKQDSSNQTGWLANIAGPRFVETDEFFETRKISLDTLEGQLKVLQSSLSSASKARRVMAESLRELGEGLLVLSTSDLSKPVRKIIERLSTLHQQAYQWALDQATSELESLITTVEAYARLTHSVRLTFNGRVKAWDKSVHASNHLKKIHSNHEKIKRTCNPNDQSTALMYSLAELEEAERRAHEARNEFADVSKLIKAEFQRFDQEKVADFKASICNFVDGLTVRQRQIVKVWQEYYQLLQDLSRQNAHATSTTTTTNSQQQQQQPPSNLKSDNNGESDRTETEQSVPVHPTPSSSTPTFTSPIIATVPQESLPSSSTSIDPIFPSEPVHDATGEGDEEEQDHHQLPLSTSSSSASASHLPPPHQELQPLIVPDDSAVWATDDSPAPNPISALDLPSYE
ncbi:hypothetical protein Pst134EA_005273 [Puccinia striiformis f. sp. tritici]|uniref:hypothetical protein n=1 Tax=Puccinia striiformis f. sp. tritici TaxID=168172 RepID=UPI002008A5E8|nr:hypothetical protein Pst134EA_005273 [Puccinia striiformis f. sp. tritici]KAH9471372.1 hypothetical protein Pst134EA_005273 [Puccinia striiformis f. sp. tritici]